MVLCRLIFINFEKDFFYNFFAEITNSRGILFCLIVKKQLILIKSLFRKKICGKGLRKL